MLINNCSIINFKVQKQNPMGKKSFKRKLNPDSQQTKLYDKITYLETKIINKINQLKKTKHSFNLCDHLSNINEQTDFDQTINYYNRFWKEYLMTLVFIKKLQQQEAHVNRLEASVAEIEVFIELGQKKIIERQAILDMPALAKVKKPISKHPKLTLVCEKQQEKQAKKQLTNSTVQLKKQQDAEPHLINYHSSENQIFYE